MEGTTDEQRSENERLQAQSNTQAEYVASSGLAGFPTATIPNGSEVHHAQVLDNERTHVVEAQNGDQTLKTQDGVATSLSLAQVPQNVSVVSVSVNQDGQIVDGTMNNGGTTVERPEDATQTANLVAVPADYHGLTTGHLQASYVLPAQTEGDDSLHGNVDGDDKDREDILREQKHAAAIQIEDRFLPIANVARIMKKSIPRTGKIAKDAKECVQECVSEFISFITSEASDRCHQEKRKTINGEDILFAMSTLGFDNYVEPLKIYLQKYRDSIKGDKSSLNSSTSENQEESMDSHIHPTMITAEQASTPTMYTPYQTQMQQPLHFP